MSTEPNIKYRLTGASVLIALAIIFLPLILDGQKKNQILDSRIPDKPISGEIILVNVNEEIKKNQQEEPTNSDVKDAVVLDVKPITESSPKKTIASDQKQISVPEVKKQVKQQEATVVRKNRPSFKGSAFVIQIGSFGNKVNANKLVDKIKAAGYKAYLKQGSSNGKIIHRVLVGPDLKRSQAESKIVALNKISGLKALIVTYDPLKH